jgi:hypothetical protein
MIPVPGESPGQWWANTGYRQAAEEQARLDGGKTGHDDPLISFYNGVPRPLAEEALRRGGRGESPAVFDTPWPLGAWPDVPTKFILCQDDRFFPAAFMRRVAQERLGAVPDEIPGCHCAALSHPRELSDLLVSYLDRHAYLHRTPGATDYRGTSPRDAPGTQCLFRVASLSMVWSSWSIFARAARRS